MSQLGKFAALGRWFGAASLAATLALAPTYAQDAPKKEEPKKEAPKPAGTIADPAVDIGDLKLMLEPLTRAAAEKLEVCLK